MKTAYKKGFTLIELLIVMAILGVLAVVVLVAINPVQQLARTRDAGRKSAVTQLGHALEAFYTSHGGVYLTSGGSLPNCTGLDAAWIDCLVDAGELSSVPSEITRSVGGAATIANDQTASGEDGFENGYYYAQNGPASSALVIAELESDSEASKCSASSNIPWFVWSTEQGRAGLVCSDTQPDCNGVPPTCPVVFNATQ